MMVISLAVFGPQSRAPTTAYLESIRCFVARHPILQRLVQDISTLTDVWYLLAEKNQAVRGLAKGPLYADILINWLVDGKSEPAASTHSGAVALPRLAIIQLAQYFQFLQSNRQTHAEFATEVKSSGSIQGYCGGLPAATALACAVDELELPTQIISAVRIAYAIGLYAELGDDPDIQGNTTIVVRLKDGYLPNDIVGLFPGTYVSAVNDPKSISIVGPVQQIGQLQEYATNSGLLTQCMDIRGKTHNPENIDLAVELGTLCDQSTLFAFPSVDEQALPLRSNITGKVMLSGSLNMEIVKTILASTCEWYRLLTNVALDFKKTGRDTHNVISFGIGDCISLMPFNKLGLSVSKADWSNQSIAQPPENDSETPQKPDYTYPGGSIAIIGSSCRLPGANNLSQLWEMMSRGEDMHEEVRTNRVDLHGTYRAAKSGEFARGRQFYGNFINEIDRFDHAFFGINRREMANMDPQQRILLELAYEAMECAGYTKTHVRARGDNIGCFIGASFVEYLENTNSHPPTAYTSTSTIRAFLCGRISYHFGWTGPSEVVDTACSSSLVAINRAIKALQGGECAMALAGGVNLITGANNFLDLAKAGFLSPTGQCKPFDQLADGYCRADGAGLVVLKPLRHAQLDNDDILAVIPSAATNQGGLSSSLTIPDPNALCKLYSSVLAQAEMRAETVTYIEAHGTGTQAGDPLEVASIQSIFGNEERKSALYFGSIKGNIGHCETAAGVAGLLKVICMLAHGKIPPQASHTMWNTKIPSITASKLVLPKREIPWVAPFRAALVNSYGAAGSNAALLCCEPPPHLSSSQRRLVPGTYPGTTLPVLISAKSAPSLRNQATSLITYLSKSPRPTLAEVSYTMSERRNRYRHRIVFQSQHIDDFIKKLSESAKLVQDTPPSEIRPTVLIFGGQSKKTIGLPRVLYDQYFAFREEVNACDTILKDLGFPSILPAIFQVEDISDIVTLQTGFVVVQYAFAATWIKAGLKVATTIGHSLGELTALAVSGVLSIHDCLKLVATRATLMKTKWGEDTGAMLAIFAKVSAVQALISSLFNPSNIQIACYNSEMCQIVSGNTAAIMELEDCVRKTQPQVRVTTVNTSNGFHSHLVDPILGELQNFSRSLSWKAPSIPIELCSEERSTCGVPYDPSRHARQPVFFVQAIKRIEEDFGTCNWLEAGISASIISMAKRTTVKSMSHNFFAASTDSGDWTNFISEIVSALWKSSVDITHWLFLSRLSTPHPTWLPPYQFDFSQGWVDNIDHAAIFHKKLLAYANMPARLIDDGVGSTRLIQRTHSSKNVGGQVNFEVSVNGKRFRSILEGHSVRGLPLCPASLYLECVTMALAQLLDNAISSTHVFEQLDIQAPLGLDTSNVFVTLRSTAERGIYHFSIHSDGGSNKIVLHAEGHVARDSPVWVNMFNRVVCKQIQNVLEDDCSERVNSARAYNMFSRIVSYSPFLKGISRISMRATESVADIEIPQDQPGLEETTAVSMCDSVSLDNFVQVLGLAINSSSLVSDNEVMVCNGINRIVVASSCNMETHKSWHVYTCYTETGTNQVTGDVYVLDSNSSVVAALHGCRFVKLAVTRLEKLLASVNSNMSKTFTKVAHRTSGDRETTTGLLTRDVAFATANNMETLASDPGMEPSPTISGSVDGLLTPPSEVGFHVIRDKILDLVAETTGVAVSAINEDATLGALGMDSLALTEILSTLTESLKMPIEASNITLQSKVQNLLGCASNSHFVEVRNDTNPAALQMPSRAVVDVCSMVPPPSSDTTDAHGGHQRDPVAGLRAYELEFTCAASQNGYIEYWDVVAPLQNELVAAYIFEAFQALGIDASSAEPAFPIKSLTDHHPRYESLVARLWEILEATGYVRMSRGGNYHRTTKVSPRFLSSQLHDEINQRFPSYSVEINLLQTCGTRLAQCLRGDVDPVKLLFGSTTTTALLETYYRASPMLATTTCQLAAFVVTSIQKSSTANAVRILEVGAGTGGTTSFLASSLEEHGHQVEYMFTDISTSLVAKAKRKFSRYKWMSFKQLDIEQSAPLALEGQFDIVLGTNCVHATSNRVAALQNLRKLLAPTGFLALSEVTRQIYWYDLVFGLLDGWWLFNDGNSYPLQSPKTWIAAMEEAGFPFVLCSSGSCEDANTQHLFVGCNTTLVTSDQITHTTKNTAKKEVPCDKVSTVYKVVDGVQIDADVYFPALPSPIAMPVALMLHGGGHLTLSRGMVRPTQTAYLLQNGVLPVSLDYRLCPEVNLIDGAMADVCDGLTWIRNALPQLCAPRGLKADVDRIVVIGWSTGGHLAMSTAWTAPAAGIPPPVAILSFYSPANFSACDPFPRHESTIVPRTISRNKLICSRLSQSPRTNHDMHVTEDSNLGWVKSGDWRSELLSSFFQESPDFGLSLLLNGQPGVSPQTVEELVCQAPSRDKICAICPTYRVRHGQYRVPTCIVHGNLDAIARFDLAVGFQQELTRAGVTSKFVEVMGGGHMYDLKLTPGEAGWDDHVAPAYKFLFDILEL